MTTGLGQNCVTRGRGPLEIPFCKPQIGAKTETWLENSWRRSDNIVGDLEENYGIWIHVWKCWFGLAAAVAWGEGESRACGSLRARRAQSASTFASFLVWECQQGDLGENKNEVYRYSL